ncbi:AAA family ATPase [Paraglaciecola marina]|uniref:AAA family ATPase n=2 Tax=Paraglaciecola TaxID=1621534 RepID=UPI00105E41CE|nr:ATP-binding protein [Paraglaciecola marina]
MIKRIVFLGGPSTGKTSLCEALATSLNTITVPEYGREYWITHQVNRRLTPEQLLHIAKMQNQWEDQAAEKAKEYLLCDTSAFTTWHFAMHYHQQALPELEQLAKDCWNRYALVVLCGDEIPYDDTWERSGDANRQEFQAFNRSYMQQHKIPYIEVTGDIEQRKQTLLKMLTPSKLEAIT